MTEWKELSSKTPAQLRQLQSSLFVKLVRYLLPFHPFYRQALSKINLHSIRSIDDIAQLPFSSKEDILPTPENPGRARDFILQPNEELIKKTWPKTRLLGLVAGRLFGRDTKTELEKEFKPIHTHFTTGRSTAQIPFFYSAADLERLSQVGRRIVEIIGLPADTVVVNAFPFAPHLAFWQTSLATQASRLLSVQTGGGKVLGTQKILDLTERLKANLLITMPGYGYHLLRQAVEQKRDFSQLRYIVVGGEKVSPGLREKMKELLGQVGAKNVQILATYAFTEGKAAWVQCHEKSGYHLYSDLEYVELIDDKGQPVTEGQPGEIVYTALDWRASIVVRYRTGDICQGLYTTSPCQYCGKTIPRLDPKIDRSFDTVGLNLTKVKGELVNLATLSELMHETPTIAEWQLEIAKHNNDPYDLDELYLHVALGKGIKEEKAVNELKAKIRDTLFVSPFIKIHSLEELTALLGLESELKEKRIIDRRKDLKPKSSQ